MPINLNEDPSVQTVQVAVAEGEGQNIELLESANAASIIGRFISGFANAQGGSIFVGIRETSRTITGCDYPRALAVSERGRDGCDPLPHVDIDRVDMPNGHAILVIRVRQHPTVVVSQAGPFIRVGEQTRAMTREEIEAKLPRTPEGKIDQARIAELIEANSSRVVEVHEETIAVQKRLIKVQNENREAHSLWGQRYGFALGGLFGLVVGVPASYTANHFRLLPGFASPSISKEDLDSAIQRAVSPPPKPEAPSID